MTEKIKKIELLKQYIEVIPICERDRSLLSFRIGTKDNNIHTLEEAGKMFKLTRERVRQIEDKALKVIEEYKTFHNIN